MNLPLRLLVKPAFRTLKQCLNLIGCKHCWAINLPVSSFNQRMLDEVVPTGPPTDGNLPNPWPALAILVDLGHVRAQANKFGFLRGLRSTKRAYSVLT